METSASNLLFQSPVLNMHKATVERKTLFNGNKLPIEPNSEALSICLNCLGVESTGEGSAMP